MTNDQKYQICFEFKPHKAGAESIHFVSKSECSLPEQTDGEINYAFVSHVFQFYYGKSHRKSERKIYMDKDDFIRKYSRLYNDSFMK